jgi:hypothetical protein
MNVFVVKKNKREKLFIQIYKDLKSFKTLKSIANLFRLRTEWQIKNPLDSREDRCHILYLHSKLIKLL